jgi:Lysine methyltransferase
VYPAPPPKPLLNAQKKMVPPTANNSDNGGGGVLEETWFTLDGINVFDDVKLACHHKKTRIPLRLEQSTNVDHVKSSLLIQSVSKQDMTPLDCLYVSPSSEATENENEQEQEKTHEDFYDGTGHLVWMAAVSFAYLLNMNDSMLRPFFDRKRVCELGCGTGAAGIATLVLDLPRWLLFTDNNQPTLDLCHANCRLNDLGEAARADETSNHHQPSCRYSLQLFSWGALPPTVVDIAASATVTTLSGEDEGLPVFVRANGFDTVLATDAVYDLKAVTPLLESAATLLLNGGTFVLSHVPRFCLPRNLPACTQKGNDGFENGTENWNGDADPTGALEDHIVEQASKSGFVLLQTIRPCQVLQESQHFSSYHQTNGFSHDNDEALTIFSVQELQDAHAIVFIFQLHKKDD